LGISEIHSSCSPQRKQELVRQLALEYGPVAMIGDGINDAAAMSQSSIGIAMPCSADITTNAASIVLLRPNGGLADAITAIDTSQKVYQRIRLNFLWACIYNVVMIPMAAGVVHGLELPGVACAGLMAASGASVVLSSLCMGWFYRAPKLIPSTNATTTTTTAINNANDDNNGNSKGIFTNSNQV
jgi:P-type Cu+ transporter